MTKERFAVNQGKPQSHFGSSAKGWWCTHVYKNHPFLWQPFAPHGPERRAISRLGQPTDGTACASRARRRGSRIASLCEAVELDIARRRLSVTSFLTYLWKRGGAPGDCQGAPHDICRHCASHHDVPTPRCRPPRRDEARRLETFVA